MASPSTPPRRQQTLLETDEDVRRAGAPAASTPAAGAVPYRPTTRPPMAVLTVLDDGSSEGEVFRIRTDRFVIGRKEGDAVIPHDPAISSRHVEITRQRDGEKYRWLITDLETVNGLFVRASRIVLTSGVEFLVGRGRYRFVTAAAAAPATDATQPWGSDAASLLGGASLVELTPAGPGKTISLAGKECWIGADLGCAVRRDGDPFTEARHVRLFRGDNGIWQAQHNKTLNGLWLRVPQIVAEDGCTFQIGEQRLRLSVR
jgi:hypothetical protein